MNLVKGFVIDRPNSVAARHQGVAEVGADEAGSPGDEVGAHGVRLIVIAHRP